MKRTRDFDTLMSDHVNLNPSRYDRLNTSTNAVARHLSQNLPGFRKTERQGSHALGTIIRPVDDHEYDADLLVFVEYDPQKTPRDYIDDVYRCPRVTRTIPIRSIGRRGVLSLTMLAISIWMSCPVSRTRVTNLSATEARANSNPPMVLGSEIGSTVKTRKPTAT
jgi:hypothetical protein